MSESKKSEQEALLSALDDRFDDSPKEYSPVHSHDTSGLPLKGDDPIALVSEPAAPDVDAPDYERDRTFDAAEAPWVGAESAWRQGIASPALEHRGRLGVRESGPEEGRALEISEAELATVISTMPPAHKPADGPFRGRWRHLSTALELLGLCTIVALATWLVVDKEPPATSVSRSADQRDISAIPAALPDSAYSGRTQAAQGTHHGGAAHGGPDGASHVESQAAPAPATPLTPVVEEPYAGDAPIASLAPPPLPSHRAEADPAEEALASGPSTPTPRRVAPARTSLSIRDLAALTTAHDKGDGPAVSDEATRAPEPLEEEKRPVAPAGSAVPEPPEAPESAAEPIPAQPDPEREARVPNHHQPISHLEAILLAARTSRPEARVYKDPLGQLLDPEPTKREVKTLSKTEIQSTMANIAPQAARCGYGKEGAITMKMVVSGQTGRIIDAAPSDREFVGTPQGLCLSRAVRLAKFPKFDLERQHIQYQFYLR